MQRSLRKKLFLCTVFSIALVVFGAAAFPASVAAQDQLPENAKCVQAAKFFSPDLPKIGSLPAVIVSPVVGFFNLLRNLAPDRVAQYYLCTGAIPPIAIPPAKAVQIEKTKECAIVCTQAGGSFLEYANPQQSPAYFCFGATEKETEKKTCATDGGKTYVDVTNGSFLTPEQAGQAACNVWNLVGCWVSRLINALTDIVDIIVGSVAAVVKLFATLLSGVLIAVTNYFLAISVSPSSGSAPPFLKIAWATVRNFVNLFFLVILAFIGLATTLRLEKYKLQKTLPSLIIVAVLINFSPVLVGLVADIGNIITHYFLGMANSPKWSIVADVPMVGNNLGLHIVQIIYYLISILIYFVVMLVFGMRVIVLWTLAIISPIAFAMRILPDTKKWWDDWWKQLLQWSMVGIPISFFMYLAKLVLDSGSVLPVGPGNPSSPTLLITQLFAPFTVLFLLFAGVGISMTMAPAAAKGVIDWGKKAGTGIGKFAGKKTLGFARDRIGESQGGRAFLNRMEKLSTTPSKGWGVSAKYRNPVKWVQRGAAHTLSTIIRAPGTLATNLLVKTDQEAFNEAKARAVKEKGEKGAYVNARAFREAPNETAKAGIYAGMTAKQRADAMSKDKMGANVITLEELKMVYTKANALGENDTVKDVEQALAKNIADETRDGVTGGIKDQFEEIKSQFILNKDKAKDASGNVIDDGLTQKEHDQGIDTLIKKIIKDAKTADDMKQLQKGLEENTEAMEAMHEFWTGPQWQAAMTELGRTFMNRAENTKKEAGWYYQAVPTAVRDSAGKVTAWSYSPRNAATPRFFASTPAQALGVSAVNGAQTNDEIKAWNTQANTEAQDLKRKANGPPLDQDPPLGPRHTTPPSGGATGADFSGFPPGVGPEGVDDGHGGGTGGGTPGGGGGGTTPTPTPTPAPTPTPTPPPPAPTRGSIGTSARRISQTAFRGAKATSSAVTGAASSAVRGIAGVGRSTASKVGPPAKAVGQGIKRTVNFQKINNLKKDLDDKRSKLEQEEGQSTNAWYRLDDTERANARARIQQLQQDIIDTENQLKSLGG